MHRPRLVQSGECLDIGTYQSGGVVMPFAHLVLLFALSVLACDLGAHPWIRQPLDIATARGEGEGVQLEQHAAVPSALERDALPLSPPDDDGRWQSVALGQRTLGMLSPGLWVRASFVNSGSQAQLAWVQVSKPYTDFVDCFVTGPGSAAHIYRMGDQRIYAARPIQASDFLVPIRLDAHGTADLRCLIRNDGALVADLRHWSPAGYQARAQVHAVMRFAGYGALLFAMLTGLIFAMVSRRTYYFLLIADLIPVLLGSVAIEGDAFQYLWPQSPQFNFPPYHWLLLGLLVECIVIRGCMDVGALGKRCLNSIVALCLLVSLSALLQLPMHLAAVEATLAMSMLCPLVFMRICFQHRFEGAIPQVLGFGIFLQTIGVYVNAIGVVESPAILATVDHFQLANLATSLAKALMLALAFGFRAKQDRVEMANLNRAYTAELCEKLEFEQRVTAMLMRDPSYGCPNQRAMEDAIQRSTHGDAVGLTVWLVRMNRMAHLQAVVPFEALQEAVRAHIRRLSDWLVEHGEFDVLALGEQESVAVLGDNLLAFCTLGNPSLSAIDALREMLLRRFRWYGMYLAWDPHIALATIPVDEARQDPFSKVRLALNRCTSHHRVQIYEAERVVREQLLQGLAMDISGAIERGELELHYQPKVSLDELQTHSMEALVRWRHPQKGLIPPGAFIAEAEATGGIHRLTLWAIREAARFVCYVEDCNVRIAVNISAFDLATPGFAEKVLGILAEESVPPTRFILEVTESVAVADADQSLAVLRILRQSGIRIALDDFGTGQSSLGMLELLPIDEMKIDRSLVVGIESSVMKKAILRSMIDLGRRLGLGVTVEGVETAELVNWLCAAGCHVVQGYYFSRPLPTADALAWLIGSSRAFPMEAIRQAKSVPLDDSVAC